MSERRTAEIKFRVTPTEKALWQAAAESEGLGLSELIRLAVQEYLWRYRPSLDSTSLKDNAIAQLDPETDSVVFPDSEAFLRSLEDGASPQRDVCTTDPCTCDSPQEDVPVIVAKQDWTAKDNPNAEVAPRENTEVAENEEWLSPRSLDVDFQLEPWMYGGLNA